MPGCPRWTSWPAEAGLPYAGHDGKTGETLVKSVLAPMFAMRNLRVRTWSGVNLLGGGDGANLAEPGRQRGQVRQQAARARARRSATCRRASTRIEYVTDIGDFKTAWDLITFSGFLGTPMRMEFTWHGCDSALAAPLVLDLARLTAAAHAAGPGRPADRAGVLLQGPAGRRCRTRSPSSGRVLCDFAGLCDADGTRRCPPLA